jgi:hypothetical protein
LVIVVKDISYLIAVQIAGSVGHLIRTEPWTDAMIVNLSVISVWERRKCCQNFYAMTARPLNVRVVIEA